MTIKEFKSLVIDEAVKLKAAATKDELSKLDFENLDGNSSYRCIYGQITGHCYSKRASQLLTQCAMGVVHKSDTFKKDDFRAILKSDIRPMAVQYDTFYENWSDRCFSAIELSLFDMIEWHKPLIDFLKGETDTLVLD